LEGVIKAVGCHWLVRAFAHRSIIIIIVNDGRGHEAVGARVCKGIGCRINKFIVKIIPFLEKGGEVLLLILVGVVVIIIIIEEVSDGIGFGFMENTGRDCT